MTYEPLKSNCDLITITSEKLTISSECTQLFRLHQHIFRTFCLLLNNYLTDGHKAVDRIKAADRHQRLESSVRQAIHCNWQALSICLNRKPTSTLKRASAVSVVLCVCFIVPCVSHATLIDAAVHSAVCLSSRLIGRLNRCWAAATTIDARGTDTRQSRRTMTTTSTTTSKRRQSRNC